MDPLYTPIYRFPYPSPDAPVAEGVDAIRGIAQRAEQAFRDGEIPAGNPNVNDMLRRLAALEKNTNGQIAVPSMAANGSGGPVTVTFPAGMFTAPPVILTGCSEGKVGVGAAAVTKDGFKAYWNNLSAGTTNAGTFYWRAEPA